MKQIGGMTYLEAMDLEDYPFIYQFLNISAQKIPYYISAFLLAEPGLFHGK